LSSWSIVIGFSISAAVVGSFLILFLLKAKNSHLVRDESGYPSLAKFQLISWTLLIAFSYFGIYLARIIDGVAFPPPDFPAELIALMGISIVSTAINKKLSDDKYETSNAEFISSGKGYKTMVEENGRLELTRLQMFLWTIISLIIYIFLLASALINEMDNVAALGLPNVDPTLVVLMGLSQTGYLGYKAAIPQREIYEIKQDNALANVRDDIPLQITIIGKNFGNQKGAVEFNNMRLGGDAITEWTNGRIKVDVPAPPQHQIYNVRVLTMNNKMTEAKPFSPQ
jgi:hypothetical protein